MNWKWQRSANVYMWSTREKILLWNGWFVLKQHNFTNVDILAINAQNCYDRRRWIDEKSEWWTRGKNIKPHNIIKCLTKLMAKKNMFMWNKIRGKKCEKGISTCYP